MQVLFVASECAPFIKTGGLADVVSALPKALRGEGVDTRVLLPGYAALGDLLDAASEVARFTDPVHGTTRLIAVEADGQHLILLDAPHLFDRSGNPYLGPDGLDWPDNAQRFAALAAAGAWIAREGLAGWRPDVLHAHDWQAGLAPAYLRLRGDDEVATLTTVHNVAFQGIFPVTTVPQVGLPWSGYHPDGFEYYGSIGYLKAGLAYADRITTVSPTYARELMSPEFGMGLQGVFSARRDAFSGILNGVDAQVWNPATDKALDATYTADTIERRVRNKRALEKRFGLETTDDAPLFCVVSRLTRQKGLDLLLTALPRLLARGARLVVLGSGDADLEVGYGEAAAAHPAQVGFQLGYDEPLSHLMQGGADSILIPSRFEPCGLTQLYGLRYGCLPLVGRTGGLADTVIDANSASLATGVATGFQFAPITTAWLADAVERACDVYADQAAWRRMMQRAMAQPVGWDNSAKAYSALYEAVRRERR